jgi:hypothetical protein
MGPNLVDLLRKRNEIRIFDYPEEGVYEIEELAKDYGYMPLKYDCSYNNGTRNLSWVVCLKDGESVPSGIHDTIVYDMDTDEHYRQCYNLNDYKPFIGKSIKHRTLDVPNRVILPSIYDTVPEAGEGYEYLSLLVNWELLNGDDKVIGIKQ